MLFRSGFAYLQLTLQWLPTVASSYCSNSSLNMFTIHGLWPNNNDGSYPCYCSSESFDPSKVQDLLAEMDKLWPSFNPSSSNDKFWSHEWGKHGTCAADDPAIGSMYGYFYHGLGLRNKFSPASVLANKGIKPDDNYYYYESDVLSALKSGLGHNVVLSCDNYGNIEELDVCVDRSLAIMDCPSSSQSQCPSKVYLPRTKPH